MEGECLAYLPTTIWCTDANGSTTLSPTNGSARRPLDRAQYDAVVRELEAADFRVRFDRRRSAYRSVGTMTFGTFYDLIIRLSTDSGANPDALIERIQHLLPSDELPPTPRMGKILLDDGTEYAFPLDEADVP